MLDGKRIFVAAVAVACWVTPVFGVEPVAALQAQLDEMSRTDARMDVLLAQLHAVRGDAGAVATALAPVDALAAELAAVAAPDVDLGLVGAGALYAAPEEAADAPAEAAASPDGEGEAAAPVAQPAEPAPAEPAKEESAPAETAPEAPAASDAPAEPAPPAPRGKGSDGAQMGSANAAIASQLRALDKAAAATEAAAPAASGNKPEPKKFTGDPLEQLVSFDCEDMPLTKLVPILAYQAGINVIAGADLTGSVTMNLKNVTLRQAINTALFMNSLGMVEEQGVYHIVPYEEAMNADRSTTMIPLTNAKAEEISKVVMDIIKGSSDAQFIKASANKTGNIVVISGPPDKIEPYVEVVKQMDVTKPLLETTTAIINLNYSEPEDVLKYVEKMVSKDVGKAAADTRARNIIVTDLPMVVEQIRKTVEEMDTPVKQVVIDSMVVDVTLTDEADTGVDWLLNSVQKQSYRDSIEDPGGLNQGNLQELSLDAGMKVVDNAAGLLSFAVLSNDIDWRGIIQAEVRNLNGHLVSNPVVVALENTPAKITISEEIPYTELTQTDKGGSQTSTKFKDIGTVFTMTPRVTHDDHIILDVEGKESVTSGEFNGVPIESKRELQNKLMIANGQTIFVGGLRKNVDNMTVKKIPILGDVPVMNMLFRSHSRTEKANELMVFLTCTVLGDNLPALSPYQQNAYDDSKAKQPKTNAMGESWESYKHPKEVQDPIAKWRRTE